MNGQQVSGKDNRLTPAAIDDSLAVVQDVFRQCRTLILERAGKVSYTDKPDGSPVTDTDVEVEKKLQAVLMQRFPDVPVFGEESGYEDHLTGAFWLVDPIDGTKSFIANIPTFTCMAVLIQDDEATACVIYNPSTDDMYTARKGLGAYKNDTRLDLTTPALPRIANCKDEDIAALNELLAPADVACEVVPTGCGYGFAKVAEGLAAARFNLHSRGYTHDYAPGALLVREAGGAVIPVLEDTYTYETRSFVVCHPALEATVRGQLQRIRELEK